jgi:hypothetical protein
MCFIQILPIAQLRNYHLHRNNLDESLHNTQIGKSKDVREEQGCEFHMVGSIIGQEKKFCLRKMNLKHTCSTSGEAYKDTSKCGLPRNVIRA